MEKVVSRDYVNLRGVPSDDFAQVHPKFSVPLEFACFDAKATETSSIMS